MKNTTPSLEFGARVKIGGATGARASTINGVYVLRNDTMHGAPVFQKEGDPDKWLARGTTGIWRVQPAADRGTVRCWCYSTIDGLASPWEVQDWNVYDSGSWVVQAAMKVEKVDWQINWRHM